MLLDSKLKPYILYVHHPMLQNIHIPWWSCDGFGILSTTADETVVSGDIRWLVVTWLVKEVSSLLWGTGDALRAVVVDDGKNKTSTISETITQAHNMVENYSCYVLLMVNMYVNQLCVITIEAKSSPIDF